MVRQTMEYASTLWDPYKTEDVNCMDKVQRRAARYACNNYTERTPGCVTAMVSSLGWESLQDRRKMHRLTMLYKIRHNLVEIPESESIVRSNDSRPWGGHRDSSSHTPTLQCTRCRFSLGPNRNGTNCHPQLQTFRRLRPSRLPSMPR